MAPFFVVGRTLAGEALREDNFGVGCIFWATTRMPAPAKPPCSVAPEGGVP